MKSKPQQSEEIEYVVVNKLPQNQRASFLRWLDGQTIPVVEQEEPELCAYYWDYERWYRHWSGESQIEPLWD